MKLLDVVSVHRENGRYCQAKNPKIVVKCSALDHDGTIGPLDISRDKSAVSEETDLVLQQTSRLIPIMIVTTKDLSFITVRTQFAHAWSAVSGLERRIGEKIGKRGSPIAFCVDWRKAEDLGLATKEANRVTSSCLSLGLKLFRYENLPFFDVYPIAVDKGLALREMLRELNLKDGILYMGDSEADNPAFEIADISAGIIHGEDDLQRLSSDCAVKSKDITSFLNLLLANSLVFDFNFLMIESMPRREEN